MLSLPLLERLDFGGGNSCSAEEYTFLASLVLLHAPATILEIGTSTGIGALAMAAAGRAFGRECRLTTIDIPFGAATFAKGLAHNRAVVATEWPDLDDAIEFESGDSRELLPRFAAEGRTFDFVFIDGDHTAEAVRADWAHALALRPKVIVLHDSVHHESVAALVHDLKGRHEQATFTYPPGHVSGTEIEDVGFDAEAPRTYRRAPECPGFTVFTDLRGTVDTPARHAVAPSGHETADRLVRTGLLHPAQVHDLYGDFQFASVLERPGLAAGGGTLEIVLTGRNDGFGGDDFNERMFTAAAFNHRVLTDADIPHTFTLVEWNPAAGRPLLADLVRERFPWWGACYVVSPDWHDKLSENPRLQFMEFFAKNVAIRRSVADWILTTNTDIFLSREIVDLLKAGPLVPGTLYRALRIDIDRHVDWRKPDWPLFANRECHLRRHELEAPYFSNGAGDFLLLDGASWHALGGFNETVRFAKIYKDGQFCVQAHFNGLRIETIGEVYHLDHDGSFVTATKMYGERHEDAPFGPWWDAMKPYTNRRDWGLTAAVPVDDRTAALVRLLTPETSGPAISFICNGAGDPRAVAGAVSATLEAGVDVEVIVVNAGSDAIEHLPDHPRVRLLQDEAGESIAARINRGLASARGRLFCVLPRPAYLGAAQLKELQQRFERAPGLAAVTCAATQWCLPGGASSGSSQPARQGAFTLVRRAAYERVGEWDELAPSPQEEYWRRLEHHGCCEVVPMTVNVIATGGEPDALLINGVVESSWLQLAPGAPGSPEAAQPLVSRLVLQDHRWRVRRIEEAFAEAVESRLKAEETVAIWGFDALTPTIVSAVRRTGRLVSAIYTQDSHCHGDRWAGIPVRAFTDQDRTGGVPVIVGSLGAGERAAAHHAIDPHRLVHLCEGMLPGDTVEAFPLSVLAEARQLRQAGQHEQAFQRYAQLAGFQDWRADLPLDVVAELADVATRSGRLQAAVALYRFLFRASRSTRTTTAQRLGSVYKTLGRTRMAQRCFQWALRQKASPALRASCHFHLGELCWLERQYARAQRHFIWVLATAPTHEKAAAYLRQIESLAPVPRAGSGDGRAAA